jgi:hypothetical protein
MRTLSAAELLNVWEDGRDQSSVERGLALLAAAYSEASIELLAKLPIGRRDALLLRLRDQIFGPKLVGLENCPSCGEGIELIFHVADILVDQDPEPLEELSVEVEDYRVQFRLPNCIDLISVADQKELATKKEILIERCILMANYRGEDISIGQLPAGVLDEIVKQMAEADPQADVQIALSCPACKHEWQATFDIMSFFWNEINDWADRILRDVHKLAYSYGWSEREILGMNPRRRQAYMDLIDQ